jgi:negative regulator of sigma E activity
MTKTQEILLKQFNPAALEAIKSKKLEEISAVVEAAQLLQSLLNEQQEAKKEEILFKSALNPKGFEKVPE